MVTTIQKTGQTNQKTLNIIQFLQQQIECWEIEQEQTARHIVKLIPSQCPFAREIKFFGKVLFPIPPLCKLNPLYDQLIELRFRALCFLENSCG